MRAAVARCLAELAGLAEPAVAAGAAAGSCAVEVVPAGSDGLQLVASRLAGHCADMLLLHGESGSELLHDLDRAEASGLVGPGCLIVVDRMLRPGAPGLLWRLHSQPGYEVEVVPVAMADGGEDWTVLATCLAPQENGGPPRPAPPPPPPELAALAAEADALGRRRGAGAEASRASARLAQRTRAVFAAAGLAPRAVQ